MVTIEKKHAKGDVYKNYLIKKSDKIRNVLFNNVARVELDIIFKPYCES